ncbi:MAG: SRPBCC family protein [bacterium]
MTDITRSIEISASVEKVWLCIHPQNWTKIFNFVKGVNGFTNGKAGLGTRAEVVAGKDDLTAIKYNVEITEFLEHQKIAYRRYGGPLTGKGVIQLKSLPNGTLLTRTAHYDDALSEQTIEALSEDIEYDNFRIKKIVEEGD